MNKNLTALVTGGHGYIGRALCDALQTAGWRVINAAREPTAGPWHEWVYCDLEQPFDYRGTCDVVFHCAGKAHAVAELQQDEAVYQRINTLGTKHILDWAIAQQVPKFIYFSSVKALGEGGSEVLTDEHTPQPVGAYGISKLAAEKLLAAAPIPHWTILRPTLVYGGKVKGNLHKMLEAIAQNRFPSLPEIHNQRSMVCLYDTVRAAIWVCENPDCHGQTYILEDGQSYSTRQIYEMMAKALGRPVSRFTVPRMAFILLGKIGDAIGRWRGRRFFFDSESFSKLFSSSRFRGERLRRTGFSYHWTLPKALPEMIEALHAK